MIWLTLGQEGNDLAHARAGGEKPGSPSGRRGEARLTLGQEGNDPAHARAEGMFGARRSAGGHSNDLRLSTADKQC
jgi:hypothetical protein